jgi:uncharacterized membrane protein
MAKLLKPSPDTCCCLEMLKDSPIRKLTEAVFGFALAVGALSLTSANPQNELQIVAGLLLFSLSFIILVVIWWGTSNLMSQLDQEKSKTIFLNIALLFFVAIEPYLLNVQSVSQTLFPFTSALYAIDMAFLLGISAALSHIVLEEKKETLTSHQLRYYTMNRNYQFVFAGLFLFSIVPQFAGWTLAGFSVRSLIWFVTLGLAISLTIALNRKK